MNKKSNRTLPMMAAVAILPCLLCRFALAEDAPAAQPERPNILWITAEDICSNLGCYGDPDAITPSLDRFADNGVQWTNVFSIHPCCSPSRSCLATGVYPTRLGTFQHRSRMWVAPNTIKCFTTLLRQAGYYCFNGSRGGGDHQFGTAKLDYNFQPQGKPWDKVGSQQIEWRNRPAGQPFFGQINLPCTHQSQYGKRKPGASVPGQKGIVHDPAKIRVPPYHPDTPAVREIWAEYHDRITQMDQQFGALLKQLKEDGLAEETIVFFFGDNGQGIPGGKIWLWDQGVRVPLLIRFPKKWAHLAPSEPGSTDTRLISFLDFAPTVLSLTGVDVPDVMQGIVFLGPEKGPSRDRVFAARDYHDGADFDAGRMVRDRRYHYIRNLYPHLGWDAIQYSWQQAPYMLEEWRQQAEAGKLKADTRQACFFRRTKPAEELYDMQKDPYQMHNLAADPKHQQVLQRMRAQCDTWVVENHDLGLLSQYELYTRSEQDSPYLMAVDPKRNPVKPMLDAAGLANRCDPETIPQLLALLKSEDGAIRRWGAIGLFALRKEASRATDALVSALGDPAPDVRMTAAEALCGLDRTEAAMPVLIELLSHESRIIRNETLLTLCRIGEPARAALPHLDNALAKSKHSGIWSYDNIPDAIRLARACMGEPSEAPLRATRRKYLP